MESATSTPIPRRTITVHAALERYLEQSDPAHSVSARIDRMAQIYEALLLGSVPRDLRIGDWQRILEVRGELTIQRPEDAQLLALRLRVAGRAGDNAAAVLAHRLEILPTASQLAIAEIADRARRGTAHGEDLEEWLTRAGVSPRK